MIKYRQGNHITSHNHHPQIRTNNHVERCNRQLRYLEKVRYKWRRSRTIVRHILLQFTNWLTSRKTSLQTST